MSIKTYRPTSPARRQMSVSGFDGVDKHAKPEKSLIEVRKKNSGRNSYGRITVRHRGGGNKRKYRIIDFKRQKEGVAEVLHRLLGDDGTDNDIVRGSHQANTSSIFCSAALSTTSTRLFSIS